MTVSFNYIPADNGYRCFMPKWTTSAANTAQDSAPSLLIGMALSDAEMPVNQLVIMPSKDLAKKMAGRGSQLARSWWKRIAVSTRSVNCGLSLCRIAGGGNRHDHLLGHGNRCGCCKPVYRYHPSTDYRGR